MDLPAGWQDLYQGYLTDILVPLLADPIKDIEALPLFDLIYLYPVSVLVIIGGLQGQVTLYRCQVFPFWYPLPFQADIEGNLRAIPEADLLTKTVLQGDYLHQVLNFHL